MFPIWKLLQRQSDETFTQAGNIEFKHASAGYVKRDAWFVNETQKILLTLSTLLSFAENT